MMYDDFISVNGYVEGWLQERYLKGIGHLLLFPFRLCELLVETFLKHLRRKRNVKRVVQILMLMIILTAMMNNTEM